ncbi:hypothetical protein DPEC_G00015430 [Dallia pectoralis]|uniref:Uncharacterized protein n=1 Tax=Dallia pectoralis TaxID=75939 RepID=A0ACC2HMK0_DALPE|nr:hypothetical protein DPEC_G00015430 [Dallia pectoralis]
MIPNARARPSAQMASFFGVHRVQSPLHRVQRSLHSVPVGMQTGPLHQSRLTEPSLWPEARKGGQLREVTDSRRPPGQPSDMTRGAGWEIGVGFEQSVGRRGSWGMFLSSS